MKNYIPRLKKLYKEEIIKKLKQDLGDANIMALPKLDKIVINVGLGSAKEDKAAFDQAIEDISMIAGQAPVITKSKKAISNFKIRKGQDIGLKVTLRGDRMWEFYDRLVSIVLPRLKDFRGISNKAFDGRGNYSLGLREHTVFPEVDTNKVTKAFSMQVNINIANSNDENSLLLLKYLGMPFVKKAK
ncbi:50S ribosomal protein L5 [Candidatus Dojkabacteria bacterium]|nr:50S ribosomal protein L5 [Candidatus Dojkabacteria bacterium]